MSGDATQPPGEPLRALAPRLIARLIRSLDSRLVRIEYEPGPGEPVLHYHFEIAGRSQVFAVAARPAALVSIADLYPAAAPIEQALEQQYGLKFQPPAEGS